jgi:hypothetical protein
MLDILSTLFAGVCLVLMVIVYVATSEKFDK